MTDRGTPAFVLLSIEDCRRNFEPGLTRTEREGLGRFDSGLKSI